MLITKTTKESKEILRVLRGEKNSIETTTFITKGLEFRTLKNTKTLVGRGIV